MKRYRDTNDVDEHGVVRPGGRIRVPVLMMDSMDKIQQQVAADYVADRPRVRAFDGTDAGLHRPGARVLANDDLRRGHVRDMAEIYSRFDAEKSQEFRGDPGGAYYQGGSGELRGSRPGDPCTLNGYPGTLVEEDGKLVCRITGRTDGAAMSAYARRQEEEEESEEEEDRRNREDDPDDRDDCQDGVKKKQLRDPYGREAGTEEVVEETQAGEERNVRRDVPDRKSLDQLRRDHAAEMQREYAARDAASSQAWKGEQ
jgi:hypothetical protein